MSWFDNITEEKAVDVQNLPSRIGDKKVEQDPYLVNLARTTGQGISAGFTDEGEAMVYGLGAMIGGEDYDEAYNRRLAEVRNQIDAFRDTNPVSAYGSEIAASMLGAGKLKSIPQMMGYGAAYGYGASEGDLISEDRLIDAAQSAALTGVTAKALQGVTPKVSEAAQALYDRGIRLTPGQMMGGATKRIEQAAASTPLTGAAVDRARNDAIEDFNRVVINDALKSIGKKVPSNVAGREAYKQASDILSKEYEKVLAPIKLNKSVDLNKSVQSVVNKYLNELPEAQAKQLVNYVNSNVFRKFGKKGVISGKQFKEIDYQLGVKIRSARKSLDMDQNAFGDALTEVKSALFEQVAKQNKNAEKIRAVDLAFKRMLPVEEAVSRVGKDGTVFTPADLLSGVKKTSTKNRGRSREFARGEAEMQRLAEQGKEVLGQLSDSGTARMLMNNPLFLLGGAGEYMLGGGVPIGTLSAIPTVGAVYSQRGVPATRNTLLEVRRRLPQTVPAVPAVSGILSGD